MRGLRDIVLAVALAALAVLMTAPAGAQHERHPVLLLVPAPPADATIHDEVLAAIQARLGTLPVDVVRVEQAGEVDDGAAHRLAEQHDAWSVVWLSEATSQLHILTPPLAQRSRIRQLAGGEEELVSLPEAVASMLYTELEVVVAQEAVPVFPTAPSSDASSTPEPTMDSASTVQATAPLLSGAVGYALSPMSARGPWAQGIHGAIELRIAPRFGLRVGVDLLQSFPLEGTEGELRRWPLRVSLTRPLATGVLESALSLGGALEILRVNGLSFTPADPTALHRHLAAGISSELRTGYRLQPWLGPFLLIGADLFFVDRTMNLHEETLFRRTPLNLRFALGVSVLVDWKQ